MTLMSATPRRRRPLSCSEDDTEIDFVSNCFSHSFQRVPPQIGGRHPCGWVGATLAVALGGGGVWLMFAPMGDHPGSQSSFSWRATSRASLRLFTFSLR